MSRSRSMSYEQRHPSSFFKCIDRVLTVISTPDVFRIDASWIIALVTDGRVNFQFGIYEGKITRLTRRVSPARQPNNWTGGVCVFLPIGTQNNPTAVLIDLSSTQQLLS